MPNKNEKRNIVVYTIVEVAKGAIIRDKDLQEEAIYTTHMPLFVPCRNQAVGRRAKYTLQRGEIIMESSLLPQRSSQLMPSHLTCRGATFVQSKRSIPRGAIIRLDDLETRSISAHKANHQWIERADFVVGSKAKALIATGQTFTRELIEPQKIANRKERLP